MKGEAFWRAGARVSQLDAKACAEEILKLQKLSKGQLRPSTVVRAAKKAGSALHGGFHWNNAKAAQEWRLAQARNILRSLWIRGSDGREAPLLVSVSIERPEQPQANGSSPHKPFRVYMTTETAMKKPEIAESIVQRALADLRSWQRRYQTLKELASITKEIEKYLDRVEAEELQEAAR